jgi:hypothetical protein
MPINKLLSCIHSPSLSAFAERLNHALDLNGCSRNVKTRSKHFESLFKTSYEQSFEWLNGINMPEQKQIHQIAYKLHVNNEWLATGLSKPIFGKHPSTGLISLPLLSLIDAFKFRSLILSDKRWIAIDAKDKGLKSFAVYIDKELLSPLFHTDSYAIVNPDEIYGEGDLVLVKISHSQQIICGHYVESEISNDRFVVTFNKKQPYCINANDSIIGPLTHITTYFK